MKIITLLFLLFNLVIGVHAENDNGLEKGILLQQNTVFDKQVVFFTSTNKIAKKNIKVGILLIKNNLIKIEFRVLLDGEVVSQNIVINKAITEGGIYLLDVEITQLYKYKPIIFKGDKGDLKIEVIKIHKK